MMAPGGQSMGLVEKGCKEGQVIEEVRCSIEDLVGGCLGPCPLRLNNRQRKS